MKEKVLMPIIFLIAAYLIQIYTPWYWIAVVACICGVFYQKPWQSYLIYFGLGLMLWYSLAFILDKQSGSRLTNRIGILFGNFKPITLIWISGLIGGITSGLGAMTGTLLKKLIPFN